MIHVEPWPTTASGPYLIADDEEEVGQCQVVEGDGELRFLDPPVADAFSQQRLAFVDGVRRADARLYISGDAFAHGVAGAHGTGAVLCNPSSRPEFHECRVRRLVMWGSGVHESLPDQPGGWSWTVDGITDDQPDAPLNALQHRMREAEGQLAEVLAADGCLTIIDGPLNFVRSRVACSAVDNTRWACAPEVHQTGRWRRSASRASAVDAVSVVICGHSDSIAGLGKPGNEVDQLPHTDEPFEGSAAPLVDGGCD